ncbi:MAG: hypothetical protein Q9220_001919 [cf. Caloplaca sp. 1 TL-2023]
MPSTTSCSCSLTHLSPLALHHACHVAYPQLNHTALRNAIHPIFRASNFPTLSSIQYTRLNPTLRLASRFLTSPISFSWWVTLTLAPLLPHPFIPNATVLGSVPPTYENRAEAYKALDKHKRNVEFRFRQEKSSFASTEWDFIGKSKGGGGKMSKGRVVYLDSRFEALFSEDFHDAASSTCYFVEKNAANVPGTTTATAVETQKRLRQTLLLALNLVHEIAHTLCAHYPEPYHSLSDPHNELGSSWESYFFSGGKIQPVGLDVGCKYGLMWFPWRGRNEGEEDKGERFWAVDMRWVERVCSEEGWREAEREGGRGLGVMVVTEGGGRRGGAGCPFVYKEVQIGKKSLR